MPPVGARQHAVDALGRGLTTVFAAICIQASPFLVLGVALTGFVLRADTVTPIRQPANP